MREVRAYPELESTVGHTARLKNINGDYEEWEVIDEVRVQQNEEKIIIHQKLKAQDDSIELRLGYYIIGKKPRNRNKWVWGQFCTMMPTNVFEQIIQLTRDKGWL